MRIPAAFILVLLLLGCAAQPPRPDRQSSPTPIIGVTEAHLAADHWIERTSRADEIVLSPQAIAAQNRKLEQLDRSVRRLQDLPATLAGDDVRKWITDLSARPTRPLFDEYGAEVPQQAIGALLDSVDLASIPVTQPTRFGLVVRRADVRTFPTRLRVFWSRGDTDIDRFQESALFPGTPVVIAHASRDGQWWFVVSALYAAWIEKSAVAEGTRQQVFEYPNKQPYVVVTGATAHTVFTPERPEVSQLQLDMGVRVPLLANWPADKPVNGQHPYTAHVIELPYRAADGSLRFAPALLPRNSDVAREYLPLTREHVLQQSFKFLGERYGWGHSYDARDCSGFVSEVYRSFGVQLPRNTRDQGVSPALNRIAFTEADDHRKRLDILRELQVGDLIYIPGHVMMVIGNEAGFPYVIHDTTGISYRNAAGAIERVRLNGVSVTPLVPLLLGEGEPMIDRIYSVQRIRP